METEFRDISNGREQRTVLVPNHYHLHGRPNGSQALPLPALEPAPHSEDAAATATSESPSFSPYFLRTLYLFRPLSPPPVLWEEQQRSRDTSPPTHRGMRAPPDSTVAVYVEARRLGKPTRHGKTAVHFKVMRHMERRIQEGQTIWLQGNLWDYWLVVKKDGEHGPYSLMEIIQGYHRLRTHVAILHQYVELAQTPAVHVEPVGHLRFHDQNTRSRELPPLYWTETKEPSAYRKRR
ncbi:hypothetical protein DFH06DRAFT_1136148 [Mycena polygramma]|nr:hypothetical protein DFH06DRAFT_1136148 [Mycena polygramma]